MRWYVFVGWEVRWDGADALVTLDKGVYCEGGCHAR